MERAFPSRELNNNGSLIKQNFGISKRLYVATKITAATLSNEESRLKTLMDSKNAKLDPIEYLIKESYRITDELLKQERK